MVVDKKIIELIIRQTDYDENEAKNKLIEYNNDYIKVIKNYMNPSNKKKDDNINKQTTNQAMYSEFRNLMDSASQNYRIKKEKEDKINQLIHNINKEKKKKMEKVNEIENENNK